MAAENHTLPVVSDEGNEKHVEKHPNNEARVDKKLPSKEKVSSFIIF